MVSCLCVAACVQHPYTCVSLLVDKPKVSACKSLGQNVDCNVESAGRCIAGILTNNAMNMLLMHCSESLLHCAGQTCHKATSIEADLTVADSCELLKARAASCAMCFLQCQQPLGHLMVVVTDNVMGTLHMKQRLLLIGPMHLPRSNACPVKLQQTWQLSCCV